MPDYLSDGDYLYNPDGELTHCSRKVAAQLLKRSEAALRREHWQEKLQPIHWEGKSWYPHDRVLHYTIYSRETWDLRFGSNKSRKGKS